MDIMNNFKLVKVRLSFLLISIISLTSVIDINRILNKQSYLNKINLKASCFDVVFTVLYGLNGANRILLIDRIRWGLFYLLVIYLIGIYINNTIVNQNKYIWLIRTKSYNHWFITQIKTILTLIVIWVMYYVTNIIVFSWIICDKKFSTTQIFNFLNPYVDKYNFNVIDLITVIGLIMTSLLLVVLIQFIISTITINANKGAITTIIIIIFSSFVAETDLVNPFMFSRCTLIDNRLNYNPYIIILVNLSLILISIVFFLMSVRKLRKE